MKKIIHASTFLTFIFITLLTISMAFANSESHDPASAKILSPSQIERDVKLLENAYSRLHPGYTRYTDAATHAKAWQSIIDKAEQNNGLSMGDFYLAIQKSLVLIRCDHTKANLSKAMKEERNTSALYLPFHWSWVEQRAFVTIADKHQKLQQFDEILSIDGKPIQALVEQVTPFIPIDGYTTWSANAGIANSLEFQGGALDHFGALLWTVEQKVKLKVKRLDGIVEDITVDRINFTEYTELAKATTVRNFKDAITFKRIGGNTAYLRIDTFVNYRNPVDVDDIYEPIFKAIKDEKRTHLILDLRENGGGSTDASRGLMSNLIGKKIRFKLDMYASTLEFEDIVKHLWTWDKRALDPSRFAFSKNDNGTYSLRSWFTDELDVVKPAKYVFNGKIIALTSNSNSSASTNLLSVLNSHKDVTLIGERTGGSAEGVTAGLLFTLTLPESNISTRIPFFRFKNNVTSFENGLGLNPDILAPMTAQAFKQAKDPALTAALTLID